MLSSLGCAVQKFEGEMIVTQDLKEKTLEWVVSKTAGGGIRVMDMPARVGLIKLNPSNTLTCWRS